MRAPLCVSFNWYVDEPSVARASTVQAQRWAVLFFVVAAACASLDDPSERPRSDLAGAG
jgi:hypothetical protein